MFNDIMICIFARKYLSFRKWGVTPANHKYPDKEGKRIIWVMGIKIFLLDQIYKQKASKNSIERVKCDEMSDVKAADPGNVLQQKHLEVRRPEYNFIVFTRLGSLHVLFALYSVTPGNDDVWRLPSMFSFSLPPNLVSESEPCYSPPSTYEGTSLAWIAG